MRFPPTFWDFSLWLAVTAIILLATFEIISPHYGRISIIVEKRRLRQVALLLAVLYMFTVIVRVYTML